MNWINRKSLSEIQPYDIIFGRDKVCYHNVGNKRFRILISLNLNKYLLATTRSERSALIHSLTTNLLDGQCQFCFWKRDHNALIKLDREQTQEKIGLALKDAKSKHTSSSTSNSIIKAVAEQPRHRRLSTVLTLNDLDDERNSTVDTFLQDMNDLDDESNSAFDTFLQDVLNEQNQDNIDDTGCYSTPRRLSTLLTQQDVDDYESDGTNRESDTSISLMNTFDSACDNIPQTNHQQIFFRDRRASCASHVSAFEPVDCVTAFDFATVGCQK